MLYRQIKLLLNTETGHSPFLVSPVLSPGVSRQNQMVKVQYEQ